ncbi:hypothetical protein [Bacillus badius]|uniref:hypothetical protein n=1 Tax=Bacillus badius TaxID=1455 RepID=UPI00059762E8|nr:hypothetical protein [Bacillus badius]KIL74689.1 hypothetical protein SD78_1758 [Bacillus badius]
MSLSNPSISPFSTSFNWRVNWTRLPSNSLKRSVYIDDRSPMERFAVNIISKVGLIGGSQLIQLGVKRKRIKKMIKDRKIIRHTLLLGNDEMPVYTLGINGAVIANIEEAYRLNYWLEYKTEDVLKRLVFFKLYERFCFSGADRVLLPVLPTPDPFSGAIQFGKTFIYVYVMRGDATDLMTYMKWKGSAFQERLIIVTESLTHLRGMQPTLEPLKVRIALDEDLMKPFEHIQHMFYLLEDGEFVRDEI